MFHLVGFVVIVALAVVGGRAVWEKISHWREDAQRYYDEVKNSEQ